MKPWQMSRMLFVSASLLLASCNAQEGGEQQRIPWFWLLLFVLFIVLLVLWWRGRHSEKAASSTPRIETEAPAPQPTQPVVPATPAEPVASTAPQAQTAATTASPTVEVEAMEPGLSDAVASAEADAVDSAIGDEPEATRTSVIITVDEPQAEPDDLRKIEGIGPKISQILQDAGITTFTTLAETDPAQLQQILDTAGISRIANPTTWPEQAQFAAKGDWDGLSALQDALKGGRRTP